MEKHSVFEVKQTAIEFKFKSFIASPAECNKSPALVDYPNSYSYR